MAGVHSMQGTWRDRRKAGPSIVRMHGVPQELPADLAASPALQLLVASVKRWGILPVSLALGVLGTLLVMLLLGLWSLASHEVIPVAVAIGMLCTVLPVLVLGMGLMLRCVLVLERARSAAMQVAWTDALTGLGNRHHLMHAAQQHWRHIQQQPTAALAVLMIQVDALAELQSQHGRAVGDAVLARVADVCRSTFRSSDVVARLDNETFAVLLPHVFTQQALVLAHALRARVAAGASAVPAPLPEISVSVGVAALDTSRCATLSELIDTAAAALHAARCEGRRGVHGAHQDAAPHPVPTEPVLHAPSPVDALGDQPREDAAAALLTAAALERLQGANRTA